MFLLRGSVLLLVAKWVKSSSVKILLTQGWAVKADIRLHHPPFLLPLVSQRQLFTNITGGKDNCDNNEEIIRQVRTIGIPYFK